MSSFKSLIVSCTRLFVLVIDIATISRAASGQTQNESITGCVVNSSNQPVVDAQVIAYSVTDLPTSRESFAMREAFQRNKYGWDCGQPPSKLEANSKMTLQFGSRAESGL